MLVDIMLDGGAVREAPESIVGRTDLGSKRRSFTARQPCLVRAFLIHVLPFFVPVNVSLQKLS
jgi:hypothetical protein